MYNLVKFEFYKLRHSKTFRNSLIVVAALIAYTVNLFFKNQAKWMIFNFQVNDREYGFWVNNFKDKLHPQAVEFLYSAFGFSLIIVILTMFLVGEALVDEYSNGTVKNIVAYGHSRVKIYLSKLFVTSLAVCILISFLLLGTVFAAFISGILESISLEAILEMMKFILVSYFIFAAMVSIYMLLGIYLRKKSLLVGLGMSYVLVSIFTGGIPSLFKYQRHAPLFMLMDIGVVPPSAHTIYVLIINCSIIIMGTILLGNIIFKNQDIK
ncbi:ABC transporter permease [Desnuesiella massiliensis]|uniref:ABC transporter permease n=1 Tax=Desnuesiella massiliensis TaxID=1650662 RepID=UPI0006E1B5ED|nr:ABC transporter permease [Desnuesiella massiliensis]